MPSTLSIGYFCDHWYQKEKWVIKSIEIIICIRAVHDLYSVPKRKANNEIANEYNESNFQRSKLDNFDESNKNASENNIGDNPVMIIELPAKEKTYCKAKSDRIHDPKSDLAIVVATPEYFNPGNIQELATAYYDANDAKNNGDNDIKNLKSFLTMRDLLINEDKCDETNETIENNRDIIDIKNDIAE